MLFSCLETSRPPDPPVFRLRSIVEAWFSEFLAANVQRKLALVYLCNDLIHKTRADGTQFTEQFYNKLGRVIKELTKTGDEKVSLS